MGPALCAYGAGWSPAPVPTQCHGFRSTPIGPYGKYVLAITAVRREGDGRRDSICNSISPVPKIQLN